MRSRSLVGAVAASVYMGQSEDFPLGGARPWGEGSVARAQRLKVWGSLTVSLALYTARAASGRGGAAFSAQTSRIEVYARRKSGRSAFRVPDALPTPESGSRATG